MRSTRLFSFLDLPCIALPGPRLDGRLPTSLMLAGAPGTDAVLLQVARDLDGVLRGLDEREVAMTTDGHRGPRAPARTTFDSGDKMPEPRGTARAGQPDGG